jgi:Clp amino terminal domain, pathogenicity island component
MRAAHPARAPYLGGQHLLLALAAAQPVGAVLRAHGVTPGRVEAEIVRPEGQAPFGPKVAAASSAPAADRLAAFEGRRP